MNQLLAGIEIIKSLGNGAEKRSVLNRVSIEIGEGEFVSVMGPSGSGKSTLLYTLSGMEPIDSGKVIFENQKLSELSDDELSDLRRNRMGFVFQQPTLLKNLSILDNRRNIKKLTEKAEMLMKQMGIGELKDREITQASGGQLQRAGICRALLGGPGIIFGDEPTGALNTKAAREIMELFTRINKDGTAILLVTHDPGIAARTERVLFLCDGAIASECRLSKFSGKNLEERTRTVTQLMQRIGI